MLRDASPVYGISFHATILFIKSSRWHPNLMYHPHLIFVNSFSLPMRLYAALCFLRHSHQLQNYGKQKEKAGTYIRRKIMGQILDLSFRALSFPLHFALRESRR